MAGRRIRVVIADDDPELKENLSAELARTDDIEVVGVASDGFGAVRVAEKTFPDVMLMEVHMRGMDGIEATRFVRRSVPGVSVVILTNSSESSDRRRAMAEGATAYVLKLADADDVADIVRNAYDGRFGLRPGLTSVVLAGFGASPS